MSDCSVEATGFEDFAIEAKGLTTDARLEYAGSLEEVEEAIILAHGLRSPERHGMRHALASSLGRAAVSFQQPDLKLAGLYGNIEEMRARFVANTADRLGELGVKNIILAGHSLGTPDVANAAINIEHANVESVSLAYEAGAGFTEDKFAVAAARLARCALSEIYPSRPDESLRQEMPGVVRRFFGNPIQTLREGLYGNDFDMRSKVGELDAQGFPQAMLQYENDIVFDPAEVNAIPEGLPQINETIMAAEVEGHSACHVLPYHEGMCAAKGLDKILRRLEGEEPGDPSFRRVS